MRALAPFVGLVTLAVAVVRLYITARRPALPGGRTGRIIRTAIDVYLVAAALLIAALLLVLAISVGADIVRNV